MKCYALLHKKFSKICKVGFSHFTGREMLCTITLNFQRYAKLVFSHVTGCESKNLCFIIFKISKICKVRVSHFTGREMLSFITFKFSKICKGHASQVVKVICYALLRLKIFQRYLKLALSRLTGRESERLCFITILIF